MAKQIANSIFAMARGGSGRYVEPFVGGGSVLEEVCRRGGFSRIEAGDLTPDLILMWKALQIGWVPPESIPFEEWTRLKWAEPSPLRGFAGFGASFGGHWFRAYARQEAGVESDETVGASRRSCLRAGLLLRSQRVRLHNRSYEDWVLFPGDTVYCDPEYFGTAGYDAVKKTQGKFDHSAFWGWCSQQVRAGVRVLVSEFHCPLEDWYPVERIVRRLGFSGDNQHGAHGHDLRGKKETVDKLWVSEVQLPLVTR